MTSISCYTSQTMQRIGGSVTNHRPLVTGRLIPHALQSCRTCSTLSGGSVPLRFSRQPLKFFTSSVRKQRSRSTLQAQASSDRTPPKNTEFGYSRKDVIIIGAGITGFGFALYYGLEAAGLPPATAGNFVQVIVILGCCLGWVSTYFFRVANKEMTYVKQLQDYEEAVMQKRLEELPETEVEKLFDQIEIEKSNRKEKQ